MNDERLRQLYMQGLAARERQVSRGGAPCAVAPDDLLALAREVRDGVASSYGITLVNEPVLVGCTL